MRRSKRSYKLKRRYRRKPKLVKRMPSNVLSCVRQYRATPFTLTYSVGYSYTSYMFNLGGLPNYTEFTNLFDAYRILAVKITFIPSVSSNDAGNVLNATNWGYQPTIWTGVDKNGFSWTGATYPTINTENAIVQNNNAKIVRNPLKPFSIYIKNPAVELGVVASATLVGGGNRARQWIDTDNYSVNHYGAFIGGLIPNGTANFSVVYNPIIKYYMQFKNVI